MDDEGPRSLQNIEGRFMIPLGSDPGGLLPEKDPKDPYRDAPAQGYGLPDSNQGRPPHLCERRREPIAALVEVSLVF